MHEGYVNNLTDSFKGRPVTEGILKSLVVADGDTHVVVNDIATKRVLANATWNALDVLGALVGVPRAGLADDDYRSAIALRWLANRSQGRSVDMLAFAALAASAAGLGYRYQENNPIGFVMFIEGAKGVYQMALSLKIATPVLTLGNLAFTTSAKSNYAVFGSSTGGGYGSKAFGSSTGGSYGLKFGGAFET